MRAWLRRNKSWFAFVLLSILFTLGMLGAIRLIFKNSMFGVRMGLPENVTEAEMAEVETTVINTTLAIVGITFALFVGSMVIAHFRRSKK